MNSPSRHDDVLIALRRIVRSIDSHSKLMSQRYGISGPQAMVLKNLLQNPSMTVGDLAKRMHLSQATVTDILDRLEKRNLVTRVRSLEDKRRVLLNATKEAGKVLRDAPPLLEESFINRFKKLSIAEQCLIQDSLNRVAAIMGVSDTNGAPLLSSESLAPRSLKGKKLNKRQLLV
jgi:DNA-binding MarR family transcriptional regulator